MRPRDRFFRFRVGVLSAMLAAVTLWACYDVRDRHARNDWDAPVRVGVVVIRRGVVEADALSSLLARTAVLERRLATEYLRYHPTGRSPMIQLVPYGPVDLQVAPPQDPGDSFLDRLRHAFELWRFTSAIDDAARVPSGALDSRIYVVVEPPRTGAVEGFSETRGRVGMARVELDSDTVDLALFVTAHELLHTLGASDKYDPATGRTLLPSGIPEPELLPLYPQRHAEVMARSRVLSPTSEVVPTCLSQLRVGTQTAREIGWLR